MPDSIPLYRDPQAPLSARTEDLLGRMTLEEKLGQLMQLDGRGDFARTIAEHQPGSLLHINGPDLNRAIALAGQTRLGIPLLFADDAIHGHSFWPGATIFPTQLAMASSWNTELLEQVGRATAREVACTGPRWTFSPVFCLARDLRWGRINETFGEDPFLIGELGCALLRGYQGDDLTHPESILATAKHYAGYSETQGGRDASEADLSRRKLRSYFLPPFEKAARAGCRAFMTGYQSMDGVPSTANHWLLTEVLREEWGFGGILVTDWDNVGRMHWEQHVCPTLDAAAVLALRAGNDLMMSTPGFAAAAARAVRAGRLREEEVDRTCRRILELKFTLGLFEHPGGSDPERQRVVIACPEHQALNREAVRQSLVLLQNDGLLPLPPEGRRTIALIGPNADDDLAQLGDWSLGSGQMVSNGVNRHPRSCTSTVRDALREMLPEGWSLTYAEGARTTSADLSGLPEAEHLARAADWVVAVVGDSLDFTGEGKSTATLELPGGQGALLEALARTGRPLVVILVNGKPLVLPETVRRANAILEVFNPGMAGGWAVAEALFGHFNPSGKLAISFPRHVGQQPVFYSQVRGQHGRSYADLTQEPLFPFGHGLSYTRWSYTDLRVAHPRVSHQGIVQASVTLRNEGPRAGTEIVQVYVQDVYTSITWVQKELKAFRRVTLAPGESTEVAFAIPVGDLTLVDAEARRVVEPGLFRLWVGPSSRESDCLAADFEVVED